MAELTERLQTLYGRRLAVVNVVCKVQRGGQPMVGATVRFVPESFLQDYLQPAQAVTNAEGIAMPAISGATAADQAQGIQFGYYRIEISQQADGKEKLPASYNTSTTLGQEIAPDADELRGQYTLTVK